MSFLQIGAKSKQITEVKMCLRQLKPGYVRYIFSCCRGFTCAFELLASMFGSWRPCVNFCCESIDRGGIFQW